jgi:hypothetical protein
LRIQIAGMHETLDHPPAEKLAAFALRVQPKLKGAVYALSKVSVLYRGPLDSDFVEARSMNSVFNTLLSIGLADIFELLDHNVLLHDKELEGYRALMVFFDDRPKAIDVGPEDLPPGPVRTWLSKLRDGHRLDRDEVGRYHAMHVRMLSDLEEARIAVQRALA